MSKIAYSKKRILSQSGAQNFISKKIKVNTVLTIQDVHVQDYEDNKGNPVNNDMLIVTDGEGKTLKLPVKEYMKMKVSQGEKYEGDSDNDDILLPNRIKILKSEDRTGADGIKRYPTYAYTGAQKFIDSKGALDYKATVLDSDLREDNPFDIIQNYTVELS